MLIECQCCGNEFNKTPSQIKKTLNHFCSRSCAAKVNNKKHPKRRKLKINSVKNTSKLFCVTCKKQLSGRQRKYCCTQCKSKPFQNNSYIKQQERAIKRKKTFVDRAGGKCANCGYCKNYAALSFHHREPSNKCFPLDARNMSNRTIESIEEEFLKCDLLCLNCHNELHHPSLNTIVLMR